MQVRFSTARGTPVTDEHTGEILGAIDGILLDPDTGRVEGFFLAPQGMFSADRGFVRSADIRRWGRRAEVRDGESIGPIHDHIRLEKLSEDPRRVLGQPIQTQGGEMLGRCGDVQFDTTTFRLQWLFPRRFRFFWSTAIPANAVLEITKKAIIVKTQTVVVEEAPPAELIPTPVTPA